MSRVIKVITGSALLILIVCIYLSIMNSTMLKECKDRTAGAYITQDAMSSLNDITGGNF